MYHWTRKSTKFARKCERRDKVENTSQKKRDYGAPKRLVEHRAARIGAVHLEDYLRQIQPDGANLSHGRLLQW
jgi:hypothetical protein